MNNSLHRSNHAELQAVSSLFLQQRLHDLKQLSLKAQLLQCVNDCFAPAVDSEPELKEPVPGPACIAQEEDLELYILVKLTPS